jgi:hypothetical protein
MKVCVGVRFVQRAGRFQGLIDVHSSGLLGPVRGPGCWGAEGILFIVILFVCAHEIINYCRPIDTLVFARVCPVAGEWGLSIV